MYNVQMLCAGLTSEIPRILRTGFIYLSELGHVTSMLLRFVFISLSRVMLGMSPRFFFFISE